MNFTSKRSDFVILTVDFSSQQLQVLLWDWRWNWIILVISQFHRCTSDWVSFYSWKFLQVSSQAYLNRLIKVSTFSVDYSYAWTMKTSSSRLLYHFNLLIWFFVQGCGVLQDLCTSLYFQIDCDWGQEDVLLNFVKKKEVWVVLF